MKRHVVPQWRCRTYSLETEAAKQKTPLQRAVPVTHTQVLLLHLQVLCPVVYFLQRLPAASYTDIEVYLHCNSGSLRFPLLRYGSFPHAYHENLCK